MTLAPSPFLERVRSALEVVFTTEPVATTQRALHVVPVANGSRGQSMGAIRARAAVKKVEYAAGKSAGEHMRPVVEITPASFFVVRLVRDSKSGLDDDNLGSAFKTVRDGFADALGLNDRDPRLRFVVDQLTEPVEESRVWFALYAANGDAVITLPPPRVRAKKGRAKRVTVVARRPDAKWWQKSPVPNVRRPR